MSNSIGQTIRTQAAHFLRANFQAASKPGNFLNWAANKINPRETYFHKSATPPPSTPLADRKVEQSVSKDYQMTEIDNDKVKTTTVDSNPETKGSLNPEKTQEPKVLEAQIQPGFDNAKMDISKEWAKNTLLSVPVRESHGGHATTGVMSEVIRQMEKEHPEKALALFEKAFTDIKTTESDAGKYKEALRSVLKNPNTDKKHSESVLFDVNAAIDVAYAKVFENKEYSF